MEISISLHRVFHSIRFKVNKRLEYSGTPFFFAQILRTLMTLKSLKSLNSLKLSILRLNKIDKLAEKRITSQYYMIPYHYHLLSRSRYCDIKFTVNDMIVFNEGVARQKIQLVKVLHRKRIDDDITLTSLISLDSIYRYLI